MYTGYGILGHINLNGRETDAKKRYKIKERRKESMEHMYNPVTPELVEALKKVVGDHYVKTDEEYLEQY